MRNKEISGNTMSGKTTKLLNMVNLYSYPHIIVTEESKENINSRYKQSHGINLSVPITEIPAGTSFKCVGEYIKEFKPEVLMIDSPFHFSLECENNETHQERIVEELNKLNIEYGIEIIYTRQLVRDSVNE